MVTARRPEQVADLVADHEDRALALTLDVTDPDRIAAVTAQAEATFGRIDVLVNNAGYGYLAAIEEGQDHDVRALFDTNVFGPVDLTRAVLPGMRTRRSGHIVNVSSLGGLAAFGATGYYHATKFAVEGLSESLAAEVAPLGIKVTIVEPGGFRTDWAGSSMTVHAIRDAYQPTVGTMASYREQATPLGDPVKGAAAILEIAQVPEPPLRLLLGSDAFAVARAADEAKIASDEAWKELTLSTDHDEGAIDHERLRAITATRV